MNIYTEEGTQHISHGGDQMPESFCSLSYLILAGFLLLLLLVNKTLIRFRVNAEGELNANEHTENGFF